LELNEGFICPFVLIWDGIDQMVLGGRDQMKKVLTGLTAMLLLFSAAVPGFSQGLYATVTGTVSDTSGALIPGVEVKATNPDTGVVSTTVTNEAGAYNFRDLLPGKYTISASLPGFQTETITEATLGQNTTNRFNFKLNVAGAATQVEVTIAADTIMSQQGGTVGQALNQQTVQNLPVVGNNVLDLITVMAGVENVIATDPPTAANAFGRENTTFAGVRADDIMIKRDGIDMNDNRSPNGIYAITTINPDLVGEVRLILAPVDVENGRGNGSIQYTTRSGSNQFRGSAVYSFRNNSLDPNTWSNNRSQTVPLTASPSLLAAAQAGKANLALQPNWNNTLQGTVSFGGPIVKNKTFFFGLVDVYANRARELDNFQVPTACMRMGIVRYFNGWNPTNAVGTNTLTGTTPTLRSVDLNGTPVLPTTAAPGVPAALTDFTTLQARSVFGPLASAPTKGDCSDAPINTSTLTPNGVSLTAAPGTAGGPWDNYRRQLDPSGFITKAMAAQYSPLPNNWEVGDGLNTAGYRILRRFTGLDNLFGSGEATGDRRQYNAKIDHTFNAKHKANVNFTYERVDSDDVLAPFPAGMSDSNFRRPIVLSAGFVSTLSPTLLNEARFGYRKQDVNVVAPLELPQYQNQLKQLLPAPINGIRILPFLGFIQAPGNVPCLAYYGSRPGASAPLPGTASGCNIAPTSYGTTPTWTYADTVSWSHKNHSLRFSGEYRYNSSSTISPGTSDFTGSSTYVSATIGGFGSTNIGTNGPNDFSNTNTRGASDPNTLLGLGTTLRTNADNYMNYLAGSLSNVAMQYYINSPKLSSPPSIADWKNAVNGELLNVKVVQKEFSAWIKDDWKVTKNLTLTPGLRWDYTGVPYLADGTTVGVAGGGAAAFGVSGRGFNGWLNPNGSGAPTAVQFVGPGSPNSSQGAYPAIYNNFGPAFAFAWSPNFFGEGKTTIRGGYQIAYSTGSPNPGGGRFSSYTTALQGAPGRTVLAQANTQTGVYLDLSTSANTLNPNGNLTAQVPLPVPSGIAPAGTPGVKGPRNAGLTVFDPNYKTPYVQNLTLDITRTLNRALVLDVKYVGTLSRHSYATQNLNLNNFTTNGLLQALQAARIGDDANTGLLDQMFKGINLCTTAALPTTGACGAPAAGTTWGAINGTSQRAATQIRAGGLSAANLASGNFGALAASIANLNYAWGSTANAHVCAVNCSLPDPNLDNATVGSALRLNGFPENFVWTNPQFNSVTYYTNWGWNNYHSLQAQLTVRPTHGMSGSVTWNWSKNLGLGALTNPTNRHQDYTNIGTNPNHELRTNGLFELPIGPNKALLGGSSGWIARAVEKWQLGLIYNLFEGAPTSFSMTSLAYGNGVPDVVHPVDFDKLRGVRWGIKNGNFLEGRYFDNNDTFTFVPDPQCRAVTTQQNLYSATGPTGTPRCTLQALAMVVPQGTPDSGPGSSYGLPTTSAYYNSNVQIVLQHPKPGVKGNLGNNTLRGLGSYRFDANLGKTFKISESKSFVVRFDALNVLNHPIPTNPNLNIDSTTAPFGQMASKGCGAAGQCRALQGSLRLNF
jgi:hypothetical protein